MTERGRWPTGDPIRTRATRVRVIWAIVVRIRRREKIVDFHNVDESSCLHRVLLGVDDFLRSQEQR
jgi:hypothetical protein